MPQRVLKFIVLGDSSVGKTSLVNRFCNNSFQEHHKATVGADFFSRDITVGGESCRLGIWDTAGQERFQSLGMTFYRGADAAILVYDMCSVTSFNNLSRWHGELLNNLTEEIDFVVVGTKKDLKDSNAVPTEQVSHWCREIGSFSAVPHFQTSVCSGEAVADPFFHLASHIIQETSEPSAIDLQPVALDEEQVPGPRCC